MTKAELAEFYRAYITCLNRQDWDHLGTYVADQASHNGRPFGLAGYRKMLEKDFAEIPDLFFATELVVAEPPFLATRLLFNCTPTGRFLDLGVDGRQVSFAENVFYEFLDARIVRVWSVIDKAAIEAQLRPDPDASGA